MNTKLRRFLCFVLCAVMLCGIVPPARAAAQEAATPMYRLYNPNTGEHFYTGSTEERNVLRAAGWNFEGIGWFAPTQSGEPVYRMFNPNASDHHYTMSWDEVEMLKSHGWQYEGVCWNSAPAGTGEPIFRLYNPNAIAGAHHYTGSTEERDYLVSLGWQYEGLAWFGMYPEYISRGQWIQMLVDAYGFPHSSNTGAASFTDIAGSEYRAAIETAVNYNIIEPDPQGDFNPFDVATREFAAVTAVNAMGYTPTEPIDCKDAASIMNREAVSQAVNSDFLALENGFFYPERWLSSNEAAHILSAIENEFNSANGEDAATKGIGYLDEVITKPVFNWTAEGDKLIVPAGEEAPQVGQIITFGTEKAIRVESVQKVGGQTKVTYSTPELYEYLDYIDLEGEAMMDFSAFVPAEGVEMTTNSNAGVLYGFADDMFDVPSTTVGTDISITLEDSVDLGDGWELGYSVELNVPSVSYKFDVDFDANPFNDTPAILVKNAYVKAQNDIRAHVTFGNGFSTGDEEFDDSVFDDLCEKEINLGSVPLIGIDGLCVEVEVDLIVTAEGKFTIDYNLHGTMGAQVLNNQVKNISTLQSSMSLGLEAEISAGLNVGFEAEVFGEDLFSFAVEGGGKAQGSIHLRDTGMLCMDANAHVYAEIQLLKDCLIDDWLEIGVTYTIWDESNSPFKIGGHWEDLVRVPECTYEEYGTIKGTVANADNRTQYIQGATIQVLDHADLTNLRASATSDVNGQYTAHIKEGGTVLIRISADGYIPFECLQTVGIRQTVYLETFLMVAGSEDSNETGTIGGSILNAVTGNSISDVKLTIRKGWNMTSGEIVETVWTNSAGNYSATLPIGNYTIVAEREGYVTNHINVAVTTTGNNSYNATLNPNEESSYELGDLRIVLTWGDRPSDLDSHLWGPTPSGEDMYHIFYVDMSYYNGDVRHAFLDVDDTYYYGPETTTVYGMTPNGTYSFYVHDYSNRNRTGSTVLANSGAKVEVYIGEDRIAQYFVPTSGVGNVWHVFDFNAVEGTITSVNTFTTVSNSYQVGNPATASNLLYGQPCPEKQAPVKAD